MGKRGCEGGECLVALAVLIGAVQDFVWGVMRIGFTRTQLSAVENIPDEALSPETERALRVAGWGGVESGALGALLVVGTCCNLAQSRGMGLSFQVMFLVSLIGRAGALLSGWDPDVPLLDPRAWSHETSVDALMIGGRAALSMLALVVSIAVYGPPCG
jgi:hypothetical protein